MIVNEYGVTSRVFKALLQDKCDNSQIWSIPPSKWQGFLGKKLKCLSTQPKIGYEESQQEQSPGECPVIVEEIELLSRPLNPFHFGYLHNKFK